MLLEDEAQFPIAEVGGGDFVERGDVGSADPDRSCGGREEGAEHIEEGGFAASGWPYHGGGVAIGHGKLETVQDMDGFARGFKGHLKIADFNHWGSLADIGRDQRVEFAGIGWFLIEAAPSPSASRSGLSGRLVVLDCAVFHFYAHDQLLLPRMPPS